MEYVFDGNFIFLSHVSVVCNSCFYTSTICGALAVTLIWIVQNYLWRLWWLGPPPPVIAIHCCPVLQTLTSPNFNVFRINWPCVVSKLPPFTHSVPLLYFLHRLPVQFRAEFKICLLTNKTFRETQPVYLHFMLATSLSTHSLKSNKVISLLVPRVKINAGSKSLSPLPSPSLWSNLPLSVRSATSIAVFRKLLKTHLFDLAFPP